MTLTVRPVRITTGYDEDGCLRQDIPCWVSRRPRAAGTDDGL
jgi:hypothetical protein